jgi:hypothetical protein
VIQALAICYLQVNQHSNIQPIHSEKINLSTLRRYFHRWHSGIVVSDVF